MIIMASTIGVRESELAAGHVEVVMMTGIGQPFSIAIMTPEGLNNFGQLCIDCAAGNLPEPDTIEQTIGSA